MKRFYAVIAGAAFVALAVTGCSATAAPGGNDNGETTPPVGEPIVLSVFDNEPPIGFTDSNGNHVGMTPELALALIDELGGNGSIQVSSFENAMVGLQAGRFTGVTGASITEERLKTMDMVPIYADGYVITSLGTADSVPNTPEELCGTTVGSPAASVVLPDIEAMSADCVANGQPEVTVLTFPDMGQITTAAQSGRIDSWVCTIASCGYLNVEKPGSTQMGLVLKRAVIAIALNKDDPMAQELSGAMKSIIESGKYEQILTGLGIEGGAVHADEVEVNSMKAADRVF